VLLRLTKLVAPLLAFTAEEVYSRIPGTSQRQSVHMELFDSPSDGRLEAIEASALQARFAALIDYRAGVFAAFETWKAEVGLKDSQDAVAIITDSPDMVQLLRSFGDDLPNYFKMSWVQLSEGDPSITFRVSEFLKCDRSRIRRPDVEQVDGMFLSARDRKALAL
jgi:isoleucyl-tRNA synthetase